MIARYLVDKSVWARMGKPTVQAVIAPLSDRGLLGTCAIVEMEMLYSARNAVDRDRIRDWLRAFDWFPLGDDMAQRAIELQCELIAKGNHRALSLPDLLIAAIAEHHRVTVLHYDGDYDMIAAVTGQSTEWIVPAGSVE